jgi:hypothetical protein
MTDEEVKDLLDKRKTAKQALATIESLKSQLVRKSELLSKCQALLDTFTPSPRSTLGIRRQPPPDGGSSPKDVSLAELPAEGSQSFSSDDEKESRVQSPESRVGKSAATNPESRIANPGKALTPKEQALLWDIVETAGDGGRRVNKLKAGGVLWALDIVERYQGPGVRGQGSG